MNELFIKLFSQINDGIVMFDITGKVIFSNLENSRFEDIIADNKIADSRIMKKAVEIQMSKTTEIIAIKLTMIERMENDHHAVIFQNDNMLCLYIKDEFEKARYTSLRDNMFELINHELRTPMGNFTGSAFLVSSMLKENQGVIKDTAAFNELIEMTTISATAVTRKMESLLELSEIYGDDPMHNQERIQLVDLVNSAIESLLAMSSSKGIVIKLVKKGDVIGNLYGSLGWLKRAIEECLRNSIEHTNNGGEIILQLEQIGDFAHIIIRDFGRGIASKVQNKLFEPFCGGGDKDEYSNQGLGIGLSLAKTIINNHGGKIKNVEIQKGVEFHIELPTGGVQNANENLDKRQLQSYAHDIALLMKKDPNADV